MFISQAGALNKADILYLEHVALVALNRAKENNSYCLEANKQTPKEPKLQRHTKDKLNDFFANIQFITEFLNINVFKQEVQTTDKDYFYTYSRGSKTKGYYDEHGFTVVKGGVIAKNETNLFSASIQRHKWIEQVVDTTSDPWVLANNYTFNSPSTAAIFCLGNSSNVWITWKNDAGQILDEVYRS